MEKAAPTSRISIGNKFSPQMQINEPIFDTVSTFYVALLYCEVVKRVWMLLIPINLAK